MLNDIDDPRVRRIGLALMAGVRADMRAAGIGGVTDRAQLVCFTTEGLVRARERWRERGICHVPGVLWRAYLRWLHVQDADLAAQAWRAGVERGEGFADDPAGWLVHSGDLRGEVCADGELFRTLASGAYGTLEEPINGLASSTVLARSAPLALLADPILVWEIGRESAALTHGDAAAQDAAAAFAVILARMADGSDLDEAVAHAQAQVRTSPVLDGELLAVLDDDRPGAVTLASHDGPSGEPMTAVTALGLGLHAAATGAWDLTMDRDAAFVAAAITAAGNRDGTCEAAGVEACIERLVVDFHRSGQLDSFSAPLDADGSLEPRDLPYPPW